MRKTNANLKFVIEKGEDYQVEFKEGVSSGIEKDMVAFANSTGGDIYIGITDDGEIKGIDITNQLKSKVQDRARNCDPEIPISIKESKKYRVLVIEIKESLEKPHRCSSGFYIRSGPTSQKLSTKDIRDFMQSEGKIVFESSECKKFDYKKHFDKEKLFSFMEKARISYDKRNIFNWLENLGVAKKSRNKVIFNNAGVLFFAKDLSKIFLQTEVACGYFKGTDKVHILDNKRFNQDIISNIENAMKFLWENLRVRHQNIPKTARRIDILEIPEDALREALVNAITHRDYLNAGAKLRVEIYDDRVDISSFGSLPNGVNEKNFDKTSVPRNPLIANLMLRTGYIEDMGTGISRMRKLVKERGLPPVKFEFDSFVRVTFFRPTLYPDATENGGINGENGGINGENGGINGQNGGINGTSGGINWSEELGVEESKVQGFLEILKAIDEGSFSTAHPSNGISKRSLERNLALLKTKDLIIFEGALKTGKYKVTEKYHLLLKNKK